jgi:hypothetical protein
MDEELEPVFEAVARHREKFGVAPRFAGLFPNINLIDSYVYEINKAIRENKPLVAKRPTEYSNIDIMFD